MTKTERRMVSGALILVLLVLAFALLLPDAASGAQGYSDCTDVPQRIFTEVPLGSTTMVDEFCRAGLETDQRSLGCAVYSGTTPGDFCTIYYMEGDEYVRRHECTHCRDGSFHK